MGDRPLGLAIGRIDIGDAGRVGAAPRAIIARVGPELAGLGASAAGIEHRRRGLVGEQLGRTLQRRQQPLMNRPQQEGGAADPIGQCRAVEVDALPGIDLGLAVQRQVIGVFGDQHLRDRRLGRQSALDQPRRRWRLHHHVLAGPAGVFGPADDQHAELRRHDVEPLARSSPIRCSALAAARAGLVFDIDHHLDARQVRRKRSTVHAALGGSARPLRRIGRFASASLARRDLLDVFEPEQHLIFRQRLGATSEAMALQFLDDLAQPFVLSPLRDQHRLQRARSSGSESVEVAMSKGNHIRRRRAREMRGLRARSRAGYTAAGSSRLQSASRISRAACTRRQSSPSNKRRQLRRREPDDPVLRSLGQRNLPSSSRLANRHSPVPSQKISFTRSARFARKT